MTTSLKMLITQFTDEVWNRHNPAAAKRFLADDVLCHDSYYGDMQGLDHAEAFIAEMQSTLTDHHVRIDDLVEQGDWVAARLRVSGVHKRPFMGCEVSNCPVIMPVMCLWRADEGRLIEAWQYCDRMSTCRQINRANGKAKCPPELIFDPGPTRLTRVNAGIEGKSKQAVYDWMDGAWNHNKFDLLDTLFAEDLWFWDPFGPVMRSRDEFRQWAAQIDQAFPERKLTIEQVIAEGNKTAYRVTLSARHGGSFLDVPATDKQVNAGALVMAIHDQYGRYQEAYQIFDVMKVMKDIGRALAS